MRKKSNKEIKEKILNSLDGKKVIKTKISFKGRWEMFILKWKVIRKFPDYSLLKELKKLFSPKKIEYMIK